MRLILLALVLLAMPAHAEERVLRAGRDEIHVFDSQCFHVETLLRIPPAQRLRFFKAVGLINGKTFFGCWTPAGENVRIVWEDGDTGNLPASDFRKVLRVSLPRYGQGFPR